MKARMLAALWLATSLGSAAGHASPDWANTAREVAVAPPVDSAPPSASGSRATEASLPWRHGPAIVDLGHDLKLDLASEHVFLAPSHAGLVLEKMGNFGNED